MANRPLIPDWKGLLKLGAAKEIKRSEPLFLQGSPASAVFYIEDGVVTLKKTLQDGNQTVVDVRFAGSLVGVSAVILRMPYAVSAVAHVPSRVSYIEAHEFREKVQKDAEAGWALHRARSLDEYEQVEHIVQLESGKARVKFELFLSRLARNTTADKSTGHYQLHLPAKAFEIATFLGISRQHLRRVIADMEREGVIRATGERITLLDPRKLPSPAEL